MNNNAVLSDNIKKLIDDFSVLSHSEYKDDEQKCIEYFNSELFLQNMECEELINSFNDIILSKRNFTKKILIEMYEIYKSKFEALQNYNKSIRDLLNNISISYNIIYKENIISENKEEFVKIDNKCNKYTGENADLKNYAVVKANKIINSIVTSNYNNIKLIVDDMGCWDTYDIRQIIQDNMCEANNIIRKRSKVIIGEYTYDLPVNQKIDQYKYKSYFKNRERFYFEESGFRYEYDLSVNISRSHFKLKLYFLYCKDGTLKTIFDGIGYL